MQENDMQLTTGRSFLANLGLIRRCRLSPFPSDFISMTSWQKSHFLAISKAEIFSERVGSDAPGNGCEQSTLEAPRTLPNSPQRAVGPPSRPKP